jgi:hypothetical protein
VKLYGFKVAGVLVGTVSGLPRRSPAGVSGVLGQKGHFDVGPVEWCRVYYREYGGGILPSPGRGESCVSKCPWLVPTPKGVPNAKLTCRGWFFLDADSHKLS